jgi:anti-sigma-K factor RskA
MAEQREASPRIEENVDVDEELQRMQAELAKFEDEKNQVSIRLRRRQSTPEGRY